MSVYVGIDVRSLAKRFEDDVTVVLVRIPTT